MNALAISPVIMVSPPPTVQAPTTMNRNTSSTAMAIRAMTGSSVFLKNSMPAAPPRSVFFFALRQA